MKQFLTFLGGLGFIAFIILLNISSIIAPYTWADAIIDKSERQGWELVYRNASVADITQPWTLFKKPTSHLSFIKQGDSAFTADFSVIDVLWVTNERGFTQTVENSFTYLVDCKENRVAVVDTEKMSWEWQKTEENTQKTQVLNAVCKTAYD